MCQLAESVAASGRSDSLCYQQRVYCTLTTSGFVRVIRTWRLLEASSFVYGLHRGYFRIFVPIDSNLYDDVGATHLVEIWPLCLWLQASTTHWFPAWLLGPHASLGDMIGFYLQKTAPALLLSFFAFPFHFRVQIQISAACSVVGCL